MKTCRIEGCQKDSKKNSPYCSMHRARITRHGSPHVVIAPADRAAPSGEDHPMWKGDAVSYSGAHMRVRAVRGSARDQTCSCGQQAKQWAYDHTDPNAKASALGAYSADPMHYEALCVPCHKVMDLARIRAAS